MDNKMSLREKSAYIAGRIIKEDSEIKEKIIINLLDLSDEECAKVNNFINELMKQGGRNSTGFKQTLVRKLLYSSKGVVQIILV